MYDECELKGSAEQVGYTGAVKESRVVRTAGYGNACTWESEAGGLCNQGLVCATKLT